ncbi:cytochrome b/b6 domain-containing protein [Pseudidiomarina sp. 1APP75-27a]|uniref:cytochrome b/b6 domain-containing protein n=1 Tax=Pseudidiomarina terrestris TaxID=2820060 RepID=UPI002B05A9D8|nr:cytochrome b/b6 domain-containing protein [Pseudidiomarina sp. 1APP75-27a]MEA3588764.1 cytochrome b/b6 domain-containing protein [Pseudidiomarina sp. 1APP75-27a]
MVKVWDSFIRGYHWLLVVAIGGLWWTAENAYMEWHLRIAIGVGALMLARMMWGVVGSPNARIATFVKGPRAFWQHLKELRSGNYQAGKTHNPVGGWAVLLLWSLIFVQLGTGLFATDEIFFSGPLASLVSSETQSQLTDIHKLNFNVLLTFIGVHVVAILVYRLRGENLLGSMVHGRRKLEQAPRLYASGWAWLMAAVLATIAWYYWG